MLKNVAKMKPVEGPKSSDAKPDAKAAPQAASSGGSSLSSRLMISEEDALRRQPNNMKARTLLEQTRHLMAEEATKQGAKQ